MGEVLLLLAVLSVQPPAGHAPARAAAATPSPTVAPMKTIVGEIISISVAEKLVTVAESVKTTLGVGGIPEHETVTLAVEEKTQLLRGRRPTKLEELRHRDHVVARYRVTPRGAVAVSFRVADPVARPQPTGSPAEPGPAVGAGSGE